MMFVADENGNYDVAPRVGAWIETSNTQNWDTTARSHPVWVRGLKPKVIDLYEHTGCRTPCGCVD